jgi:hypothetical protein
MLLYIGKDLVTFDMTFLNKCDAYNFKTNWLFLRQNSFIGLTPAFFSLLAKKALLLILRMAFLLQYD